MQFTIQNTAALAMLFLTLPALSEPLRYAQPSATSSGAIPAGTKEAHGLQLPHNPIGPINNIPKPIELTPQFHPVNHLPVIHNGQPGKPKKNSTRPHGAGAGNNGGAKLVQALKAYHDQVDQEFDQCVKQNGVNKCLSRINGPMPAQELKGAALQQAKQKYHNSLGKELAECSAKSKDLKGCMDKSTAKGDKFQKRGKASDFFGGFVKGFTGVFQAAAPLLETVIGFL